MSMGYWVGQQGYALAEDGTVVSHPDPHAAPPVAFDEAVAWLRSTRPGEPIRASMHLTEWVHERSRQTLRSAHLSLTVSDEDDRDHTYSIGVLLPEVTWIDSRSADRLLRSLGVAEYLLTYSVPTRTPDPGTRTARYTVSTHMTGEKKTGNTACQ